MGEADLEHTVNGIGATLDLTTDKLIGTEAGLKLVRELMHEVMAIAASEGVNFGLDMIDSQIRHTRTMGAYLTSMQVDRRAGRRLEVDAILGEPLARARVKGVATPVLESLYRLCGVVDKGLQGE